jgi:hypothetical protein
VSVVTIIRPREIGIAVDESDTERGVDHRVLGQQLVSAIAEPATISY